MEHVVILGASGMPGIDLMNACAKAAIQATVFWSPRPRTERARVTMQRIPLIEKARYILPFVQGLIAKRGKG